MMIWHEAIAISVKDELKLPCSRSDTTKDDPCIDYVA
jgi:hypothetical protein